MSDDLVSVQMSQPMCIMWAKDIKYLCDRIEELEAKLAKAVEALEGWINVYTHCTIEEGVCCCGDDMKNHTLPMDSNHMPLDHGAYIAGELAKQTEITLAELKNPKYSMKGEK